MHTELDARRRIDRLFELLPAVIQYRDREQGDPLRALLQVIAEQVDLLEDDLLQLYDNWFIETCEPWVIPYIADLIGYQPIHEAGEPGQEPYAVARNAVLLPRREVAHTLRYRRRKGTLALLEQLAFDVAGWPAHAVEFGRLLAQTYSLRLPHRGRGRFADLREPAPFDRPGGVFDRHARVPDVRRIVSSCAQGRYGPANVGMFLWRLKAYSVTRAPAAGLEEVGRNAYTFSTLANNAPLFNHPRSKERTACALSKIGDMPHAIDRTEFSAPRQPGSAFAVASTDYYGLAATSDGQQVAQSVAIWAPGWPNTQADDNQPIPAGSVIVADLDGWIYQPPRDCVAVDPVLGRIAFPPRQSPTLGVAVSYYYGFSADVGGGEYTRPLRQHAGAKVVRVVGVKALSDALKPWQRQTDEEGNAIVPPEQPEHAVIELGDSGVYSLPIRLYLGAGHSLQLRAAQRTRPVLRLIDWQIDKVDNVVIVGMEGSRFTLDGILIAGRGVQISGALASFTVRHSTLVPGWTLTPNCDPRRPSDPSIEVVDSGVCIVIEHSIVGSIQVNNDEVRTDPIQLRVTDSVIDATGTDCDRPQCEAIGAAGSRLAFAALHIARSTLIGRVMVHAIHLAENSLFMGRVSVARRQIGCMRFCYLAPFSRTPRRFECQPDLVRAIVERDGRARGDPRALIDAALEDETLRVRPRFDSLRYGMPTYCRLAVDCAPEIMRGAEDESEMGVYHGLYQPQREANLRLRLEEFSPAGADAGILFAD